MSEKKALSPSNGMTRGLIGKLQDLLAHGLEKSAVLNAVPTVQLDEFIKTTGADLRDVWVETIEKRFQATRKASLKSAPQFPILPAVDEWFELEVNDDVDPMSVVTSAGLDHDGWEYLGPQLSGKKIYRVKLIEPGYVQNLDDAKAKARAKNPKYRLLEGQAREPLKAKYPRHNGRPIVFGGSEWRRPRGSRFVAYLGRLGGGEWESRFVWSDGDFGGDWLWAVVEQD